MAGRSYLVLLTVLALSGLVGSFLHDLLEGEPCSMAVGGEGVCTRLRRCRGAFRAARRGKLTGNLCSYAEEPIICCEKHRITQPKQSLVPLSLTADDMKSYHIANEKCKEYANFAFRSRTLPTLNVIPQIVRELECVIGEPLIVGGIQADSGEFPHMVALGYPVTGNDTSIAWNCGGTLISEQFVLTAAHCKHSNTRKVKYALLGALSLRGPLATDKTTPLTLNVIEFITHKDYKRSSKYHDIALARLDQSLELQPYLRPACLHTNLQPIPERTNLTATGWGLTNSKNGEVSDVLMKVSLELFSFEKCQDGYPESFSLMRGIDNLTMICAGDPKGLKDTCNGDSGGPMQIFRADLNCSSIVVAVTSFGSSECVSNEQPGLYTKVLHYVPWIQQHVWPTN